MLFFYLTLLDNHQDLDLFEHLYLNYRNQMISIAYSILKSNTDAEDAVHDAFVGIAKNFSQIKKMNSDEAKAYLYRSARNCAINIYTKQKKFFLKTILNLKNTNLLILMIFYYKWLAMKMQKKSLGV